MSTKPKPTVRAKRKPSPRLRHHSHFLVLPASFPPAPWSVYDPNKAYAGERVKTLCGDREGYRPIWIRDANNTDVFHVGDGERFARLAAHLVRLYNMNTLKGKHNL